MNYKSSDKELLIIFIVVEIILLVLTAKSALNFSKVSKHVKEWEQVRAEVTYSTRNSYKKTVINYYNLYVDYDYNNVHYEKIKAGKSMTRNTRGTYIDVYVNPDKPYEITSKNEKERQMYYIVQYGAAMIIVAVVAMLIRNKQRSRNGYYRY